MLTHSEESAPLLEVSAPPRAAASPFANRDFCFLLFGGSLSTLGDQFSLVALPWLVLELTGNGTALGLVLAAMALPRALFLLVGGAVVDRMSPRRVLLVADGVNAVLVGALAALVLTHSISIQWIYVLSVGIGLASAFAYPAGSALLPKLVAPDQLQAANSLTMGIAQVCALLGPALAGLIITFGSAPHTHAAAGFHGIGLALCIDAASFVISLVSLLMIRIRGDSRGAEALSGGLLADVATGLRAAWKDSHLRAFLFYGAAACAFLGGSLQVGLPVLAVTHLKMGATSLGFLMTATGLGFLVGSMLSGSVTRALRGRIGTLILAADCLAGMALAALSLVTSTIGGAALLLLIGTLQGILQVAFVTWLQRRMSDELMGRTMSIVMFVFTGVAPIIAIGAGALLNVVPVGTLFVGAGFGMTAVALYCLTRPSMRRVQMTE